MSASGYSLVWQKTMLGKPTPALVSDDLLRYQQQAQKGSGYDLIVKVFPLTVEEYKGWKLGELAELYPCPAPT